MRIHTTLHAFAAAAVLASKMPEKARQFSEFIVKDARGWPRAALIPHPSP